MAQPSSTFGAATTDRIVRLTRRRIPPRARFNRGFRSGRSASLVDRRLEEVRERARSTENMLPVLRQALRDRCSLGEVCGAMRDVFGDYRPAF